MRIDSVLHMCRIDKVVVEKSIIRHLFLSPPQTGSIKQ